MTSSYDTIQIETQIFKDLFKSIDPANISSSLQRKKKELYDNYKCFYASTLENTNIWNDCKKTFAIPKVKDFTYNTSRPKHNRLYAFSSNFTEENKSKKNFISLLNKLTEKNKESIYIVLTKQEVLKQELYNLIWDFIKKSPDLIYIELLYYFDYSYTEEKWKQFLEGKNWCPSEEMQKTNLLITDESIYDLYCAFVKWKKEITNLISAWGIIFDHFESSQKLDILTCELYNLFNECKNNKNQKHITDFALNQIHILSQHYISENILDFKNMNINDFDLSSKFMLMNIIDLL